MKLLREYVRDLLDAHHAEGNPWEQVFQAIKANRLHGAPDPDINIDFLADVMNKELDYDFDRHAFVPTQYSTFEDCYNDILKKKSPPNEIYSAASKNFEK